MSTETMNTGKPFFGYFSNKSKYNDRGTNVDTSAICFVADEHALYNRGVRFTGYDASGNDVRTTYVKGVAASGNYVQVTKGDGTTSNVTVPFATSATTASKVSVSAATDNTDRTVCFNTSTDLYYDTDMTYNASTNLLKVGQIKLNGTATTGATMQYDASEGCVKFVFA